MITTRVVFHDEAITEAMKLLDEQKKKIVGHEVTIGIHEEQGSKAKLDYEFREGMFTLAQIMIEHEFGTSYVPERSFLRSWFDAHVGRFAIGMFEAMKAEFLGDKTAVEKWARETHRQWLTFILAGGNAIGLSPVTIELKTRAGLSQPEVPLMATHQFYEAWKAKLDGAWVSA